jgi:hypothetical protein
MRVRLQILIAVSALTLFAVADRCEAQPTPLAFDAARARDAWTAVPLQRTIGLVPPRVLLTGSGGAVRPLWVLVGMAAGAVVGGTAGTPPADPVFPYWPPSNVRQQTILGAVAGALGGVAIPQGTAAPQDPE